jgi:uncharacterized protein (DUF1697 family)
MRYAAFLRGVMPGKPAMPQLKAAFEAAGFGNVVTVLGSGNVLFDAARASTTALEKKADAAMHERLGKVYPAFVRPLDELERLLAADPFRAHRVPSDAKRVVTFFRGEPSPAPKLPIARDGAQILRYEDGIVFSAYVPSPKGPVFMALLEKSFGKEQTTRTWQTLEKVVKK